MLTLELRNENSDVVGRLIVDERGPRIEGRVPTDLPTIAPNRGQIAYEDDPEAWARNLHRTLRTPYLRPVLVDDTGPCVDDEQELTRAQAAQLAGVTPSAWSSYVSRGYAPAAVRTQPTPLWRAGAVRAYAEQRQARRPRRVRAATSTGGNSSSEAGVE